MKVRLTRRGFLRGVLGAGAGAAAVGSYGHWVESQWLLLNRRQVVLNTTPNREPFTILHLSDLHASQAIPLEYISHAIDSALTLKPDIICVTGDFVTRRHDNPDGYPEVLRKLSAFAPTFATLGNHDGGPWTARYGGRPNSDQVRAVLAAAGIPCLHNHVAPLSIRGRDIHLIGLGDLWSGECRPDLAFASATLRTAPAATRVVLSHNPDSKHLFSVNRWDLLLSGHTHGGQIGVPFLARHFAPVSDKRYIEGLHRWENRWLHVSRGVGCLYGIRLHCRPEATLLTVT